MEGSQMVWIFAALCVGLSGAWSSESIVPQSRRSNPKAGRLGNLCFPGGTVSESGRSSCGAWRPRLVLLAVMANSGFAGAAAITSALATLGGPAGMLGGIAALIALGVGF